jgi:hypothetical protein
LGESQRDEGRLRRFARIRRTTGESNKRGKAEHKGQESGLPKAQGKSFFHSSTSFEVFLLSRIVQVDFRSLAGAPPHADRQRRKGLPLQNVAAERKNPGEPEPECQQGQLATVIVETVHKPENNSS